MLGRVAKSPWTLAGDGGVGLPAPGKEAPEDLGMGPGEDRVLSGV